MTASNELRLSLSEISATLVSGMCRHGPSVVTKPALGNFTAPPAWATSGIALAANYGAIDYREVTEIPLNERTEQCEKYASLSCCQKWHGKSPSCQAQAVLAQ